jgi:endo-1,4-beta-xylanase
MKAHVIHPQSDIFNFQEADRYVNFGEKNNLTITGHALISSLFFPRWIFADENGNEVSKELLIERMRNFITTVIGRYKGRIQSWEVVHEIFDNSGKFINSKFFRILGDDYVKYAFNFAREADPNCILSYSDYGLSMEAKRNAVIKMVKKLQTQGAKIDTIGIQGHCHLGFPVMEELEKSIIAFHELGCKISITEMDISVLPVYNPKISIEIALNPDYWLSLNPFTKEIPKKIAHIQYEQYKAMFNIFLKHHDKIDRVTFWGMSDKYSSKNDFPIPGRTDYPLLFDRNYKAKPVVKELIEMANKNNNQIRFGK